MESQRTARPTTTAQSVPTARPVPTSIHADRASRTLAIDWADGHSSVFDFTTLRWLCPCAYCRGEAGLPGWLDSKPTLSDVQTQLSDLTPVGNYAVAPAWADGHSTGFYTFDLLRDRCPCPECTARREAEAEATGEGRIR